VPPCVRHNRNAAEQEFEVFAAFRDERTPGIALIASRFALTTLPPNTGHFAKVAYNMPGNVTSIP
jgi:hypothetical protein